MALSNGTVVNDGVPLTPTVRFAIATAAPRAPVFQMQYSNGNCNELNLYSKYKYFQFQIPNSKCEYGMCRRPANVGMVHNITTATVRRNRSLNSPNAKCRRKVFSYNTIHKRLRLYVLRIAPLCPRIACQSQSQTPSLTVDYALCSDSTFWKLRCQSLPPKTHCVSRWSVGCGVCVCGCV